MPRLAAGEDLQNLQARQRDFEARFSQVITFHGDLRLPGSRAARIAAARL
jgi:hypothetical protein